MCTIMKITTLKFLEGKLSDMAYFSMFFPWKERRYLAKQK